MTITPRELTILCHNACRPIYKAHGVEDCALKWGKMDDGYKKGLLDLVQANIDNCAPVTKSAGPPDQVGDVDVACAEVVAAIVKNSRCLLAELP